jgi:hypothetical protein
MRTLARVLAGSISAVLVVGSLTACNVIGSAGIATSDLTVDLYLEAYPSGAVDVSASFSNGLAGLVQFASGDSVTVTDGNGVTTPMTFDKDVNDHAAYVAHVTGVSPGDVLVIALTRVDGADAPATRITVPSPFSITAPSSGNAFTERAAFPVSWVDSGGGADVALRFDLKSCSNVTASDIAQARRLVDLPKIVPESDTTTDMTLLLNDIAGTCLADLLVGRATTSAITLDPALKELGVFSEVVGLAPPVPLVFQPASP